MATKNVAPVRRSDWQIQLLPPSPNQQTRAARLKKGVSVEQAFNEGERIARICYNFKDQEFKPCSVFGQGQVARFRGGFFFCGNCTMADNQELAKPDKEINRFSGQYKCRARRLTTLYPKDISLFWELLVLETVEFERVHMSTKSYSACCI